MTRLRALLRCHAGATAIEFAVLAPVFFMMLFGIIEVSREAWTRQSLEDVAFATARCMSVSSSCTTSTTQKAYAVKRAKGHGIKIVAANVTPAANTTCKGYASSNSVQIRAVFNSPVAGLVPGLPSQITASSCFPVLS